MENVVSQRETWDGFGFAPQWQPEEQRAVCKSLRLCYNNLLNGALAAWLDRREMSGRPFENTLIFE